MTSTGSIPLSAPAGTDQQPDTVEPPKKRRRRWFQFRLRTLLIVVALLSVPLTYIAHVASAPRKGSYAVFRVKEAPPSIWATNEKSDRDDYQLYKRTVAGYAKAPFILDKALGDPTVINLPLIKQHGANAADWLADQIVVNCPDDSEILEIGLMDSDQSQAAIIVKAVANSFHSEFIEKERTDKLVRRDNLDKKFRAYKNNVIEKQRQLFELEQQVGHKDDHKLELTNRLHRFEQAAADADRAELQAELQIARGKHKLEGLAESSPEYKAVKSEIELAEIDRKFWNGKSETLTAQINENAKQMVPEAKFNGDADQLRIEIAQLQNVVNEMGNTLTKWNIELGAEDRITMIGTRSD